LDSSLIAAFLSERDSESLTRRQLRKLRRILAKLATGADHDEQLINEALSPPGTHIDGSSNDAIDRNDETSSVPSTVTDTTSPHSSPRSTPSTASFSSPLGFLRAAFPGVPLSLLERIITDASCDGEFVDGVDIERAIQVLLAEEYPRDLGEDGDTLDTLDNDHPLPLRLERRVVNTKGKKRKDKPKTIAINDIRQRPHIYENASGSEHGSRPIIPQKHSDVDIWTSVASISAQLAALLPHSESFFKSFFHSPESKTPATAVRRALTAIADTKDSDAPPLDMTVLLNLQDILRSTSEYNELNADERKRLFLDAQLCLHAVGPQVDDALDLVWLLRGLEADEAAGWKVAPYHQESPPHLNTPFLETSENTQFPTPAADLGLPLGPPPRHPPSQPQNDWSVVSSRKRPTTANRHGIAFGPSNNSHGTATNEIGLARHREPARLKERCDDLESRLREASMLAARAWKGGNSKNVGRQVARYHVEEARPSVQCHLCRYELSL
jgi:hypothetical protein